jgi:Fe-S cluster assembly protein SufD
MSTKFINIPAGESREQVLAFEGRGEVRAVVGGGGRVHLIFVVTGGSVECTVDLMDVGAECDIHALWLATGDAKTNLNIRVNHNAPDCRSFQLVKGIASGASVGSFTGEIYVAPDAQRTVALQQSRNLLLGEQARITTEPRLEIYADDVKCSHGATVGQMDDQAVFYMRQRGLSEDQARRLQIESFVGEILSHITDPEARARAASSLFLF